MVVGLWLVVGLLVLLLVLVLVPQSGVDFDAPLNFVVFRSPGTQRYSKQLVNLWVPKGWRTDDQQIPCRIEYGYRTSVPLSERRLIVYSHGNAEDLMSCSQFLRELSERVNMDAVTWDYSGYGLNPADRFERSADGVNLTLRTVVDHLLKQGYRSANLTLWGYSLGTGPSAALAASMGRRNEPLQGLILFGAYSSILDVVRDHVHPKVAQWFTERWSTQDVIADVRCPILLMHGQSDGLIGAAHSERIKARARPDGVKLVLFPNIGHTQFSWADTMKEVCRWMSENKIIS